MLQSPRVSTQGKPQSPVPAPPRSSPHAPDHGTCWASSGQSKFCARLSGVVVTLDGRQVGLWKSSFLPPQGQAGVMIRRVPNLEHRP